VTSNPPGEWPTGDTPPADGSWPGAARRRIGAKLLVTDGRHAFLIREEREDGSTFWALPGGGLEPGESLARGIRREVKEELGCTCAVEELITTCSYRHTSRPNVETRYAVLGGRLTGPPEPNPDEGITDCAWKAPGELPASLLVPFRRVLAEVLPTPDRPGPGQPRHGLGDQLGSRTDDR
jgi:8-oxo-dGTP pyrophosphatase MutT (NUDIX family)